MANLIEKELYLKIRRPQNTCVNCGASINEEGKHPSTLSIQAPDPGADDVPVRSDYCSDCWKALATKDYHSYWLARREAPKPAKAQTRRQRNATLLSYFEMLYHENNPAHAQRLYVLAHLLMKYQVFRWMRTETAEQADVFSEGQQSVHVVFRNTVTDELVHVDEVELDDAELAELKREIDEHLAAATQGPSPSEAQPE